MNHLDKTIEKVGYGKAKRRSSRKLKGSGRKKVRKSSSIGDKEKMTIKKSSGFVVEKIDESDVEKKQSGRVKIRRKQSYSSRKSKIIPGTDQTKRNLIRYYSLDSIGECYSNKLSQQREFLNYTRNKDTREGNCQRELVNWFRQQVRMAHVPNFSALTTGIAIMDVMKQFFSDIDYEYLYSISIYQRLKGLFSFIEEHLEIPNNLIIDQVVQFQNSRAFILYLENFKCKIQVLKGDQYGLQKKIYHVKTNMLPMISDLKDLILDLRNHTDIIEKMKEENPFLDEKRKYLRQIKYLDFLIKESVRYNILVHEENNLLKKQSDITAKRLASLEHTVYIYEKHREVAQTKLKLIEDIRTYSKILMNYENRDIVDDYKKHQQKEKEKKFSKQAQIRSAHPVIPFTTSAELTVTEMDAVARHTKKGKRSSSELPSKKGKLMRRSHKKKEPSKTINLNRNSKNLQ